MNLVIGELYELTDEVFAQYSDDSGDGIDIPSGDVVFLRGLYDDHGYWSDGDPGKNEHPFPAAEVEWNGLKLCSIHIKCLNKL